MATIQRVGGAWWLGVLLAAIAIIVVASRWRSIDFGGLLSVSPAAQVGAAVAYGLALFVIARMPMHPDTYRADIIPAGLSAHLLKYVPGSVWQGQRLLAVGGFGSVARFAVGAFASAGFGLAVSGRGLATISGVVVTVVSFTFAWRAWGRLEASRLTVLAGVAAIAVFVSGALVGLGAGIDPWWSASEVSGAWGFGVMAVPVPAGLGIRELFLSLSAMPVAAAELGVVHRVVTLVTDAVVGGIGILGVMRRR